MASGPPTRYPTDDERDSPMAYRQDECSHYSAIGRSIEKVIYRSKNAEFKEYCVRLLQITAATSRKEMQSTLTVLLQENQLKK